MTSCHGREWFEADTAINQHVVDIKEHKKEHDPAMPVPADDGGDTVLILSTYALFELLVHRKQR